MLTSTLRDLESRGLVDRAQFNEIPPHVEYSLSQAGKDLYPIFIEIMRWNDNHL
jgi:DNA-binding HxlR family transcriptional regulator